jgi:RHS repeat-associated protein
VYSRIGNNYLFHGREYEPEVGLYFYRNRYYMPRIGRFLQTDPMQYQDSMNLYQAFNMNPINFTDPMGNVIKAEYGKHDILSTQEVKTGKWYLDYTVIGAFNELRNAAALGINLVSNLFGTSEDIAYDVGDYGLSKVGIIERGELRDDPDMRTLFNAIMLTNPEAMEAGTRTVISKLDDLTYSLYRLVKSKGGKVLDMRKNIIVSTDAELSVDEISRVFGKGDQDYRKTFFDEFPDLKGKVTVHHSVEQQTLIRYPEMFTEAEIHSLENLRGIPTKMNPDLHLSKIRKEWNKFYKQNPTPTKEQILEKAAEIDEKYGHLFDPGR